MRSDRSVINGTGVQPAPGYGAARPN